MAQDNKKFLQMTTTPVEKLICKLAIPTIISMLITAFYNMADTYFVGQIGTSATAAVGVSFSLMALIQAMGFLFGQGSGNFISRKLGAQAPKEASAMASTAFFSSLIAGVLIAVVGLFFIEPLAVILGSTETILPYAVEYLVYVFLAAPFLIGSFVLNNQLRFQGNALYGTIGMGIGAVLNIGLDPLFIFVFELGVAGASLATAISQAVSFAILIFVTQKKSLVPLSIKEFRPSPMLFKEMFRGGLPSLARQGLSSVSTIILNTMAGIYGGDPAIAGMSVVTRVAMFANSAVIGFGQGFQPVCGFNYGAGLFERVKKAYKFCVKVSTAFLVAAGALLFVLAPLVISLFRDDPQVIEIGALALRCQCVSMFLAGTVVMSNMMLQTIGKAVPATIVAMSRQFIFFVPCILILSYFFGLTGVQIAQAVADVLSFALTVPLTVKVMREMK